MTPTDKWINILMNADMQLHNQFMEQSQNIYEPGVWWEIAEGLFERAFLHTIRHEVYRAFRE